MNQKLWKTTALSIIILLVLSACSGIAGFLPANNVTTVQQATTVPATATPAPVPVVLPSGSASTLAAYEGTLENIYAQVSKEVVNIHVVEKQTASQTGSLPQFASPFGNLPGFQSQPAPQQQYSSALGSGFIWDTQGHIVTNDHVVSGASQITVTFSDGTTVPATLVGEDPSSDLAVVHVNVPSSQLPTAQLADSTQTKVGQLAIAIGNPFGLQGTMTVGIVSALGRSIDANQTASVNGATYSIPDIIQTDAPINPGNSGGVLVNDKGQVLGVTAAIESPTDANAGIGFAIPASIVQHIIPELIVKGQFEHTYLGISGTSLTPSLAQAMNLDASQRGALVEEVSPNGPAAKAGLHPSNNATTIDGQNVNVGGDVIVAVDNQPVKSMDDLISYLFDHTTVGQKVTLTILRNGKQTNVDVTLEARPQGNTTQQQTTNNNQANGQAQLGVQVVTVDSAIANAMNLPSSQQGVLIESVQPGSAAAQAGLQGSFQPANINGQQIAVGGDVIVGIDSTTVNNVNDLKSFLAQAQPGQQVQLMIVRNQKQMQVAVTLGGQ